MSADVAIMTTACWRPYYLERTLDAWSKVRGIDKHILKFVIGLGASPRANEAMQVVAEARRKVPFPIDLQMDNGKIGPWRAIAETGNRAFRDPDVNFLIVCDEDTYVADDVLELLMWEREQFEGDDRVLLCNAHSRGTQGWDGPSVRDDPDADPSIVRLQCYFNQWGWGTWRRQWEEVLIPDWDYDGTSGAPDKSGHDWNIALRTMKGFLAPVPDASRTQHIGDREGMFSNPGTLAWSKAASFRPHRDPVPFVLVP